MEFDIRKLSKKEQSEYLDLDPADQKIFRELWIVREQELNRAKMETQRLRAKARKARTHRMIVRGAILENVIPELADMEDEAYDQLLRYARTTPYVQRFIRERREDG